MARRDTALKAFEGPLNLPSLDMTKILELQQRNLEATAKCWQVMAAGAIEVANRQRAFFEAMVCNLGEAAKAYKPGDTAQQALARQSEFATKTLEAAIVNTRDIADLLQKSGAEAMKIMQERMQESQETVRAGQDKK